MLQDFMRKWTIAITILGAIGLVIVGAMAQSAASPASKTAGDTFKNIQILKDMPADQLMPTMGFISASLGVGCDHCHVPGSFEKDDKKPKLFAREMMKMMFTINQNNFEGKREVTCNSCHHGAVTPAAIPLIPAEETKPEKPVPPPQVTADQILDKYVQAVGGADALQKISSRVSKGKATVFGGHQFPIEVFVKSPEKWASYLHLPPGDNATVYDGQGGWMSAPGRPSRELGSGEIDAIKFDADLQFPLSAKKTFTEMKVTGTEKVDGHDTYVVTGERGTLPPVLFYFDQQTGLLLRELRYDETPLGRYPTEVDYGDYRDSGGTKVPFQWTVARPGNRAATQIDEVQNNVPIDDAKFAKPPEPPPSAPPAAPAPK